MMQPIHILVADNHTMVRQGLSQICDAEPDMCVVGQAVDGYEAHLLAMRVQPDVVIVDSDLPMLDGVQTTRQLTADLPGVGVIVLTMDRQSQYGFEAIKAGARAYLLKDADSDLLLQTIRAVAMGEGVMTSEIAMKILDTFYQQREPVCSNGIIFLNQADLEILNLFAQGMDIATVSHRRGLAVPIVRDRVNVIFEKLHVSHTLSFSPYALN